MPVMGAAVEALERTSCAALKATRISSRTAAKESAYATLTTGDVTAVAVSLL